MKLRLASSAFALVLAPLLSAQDMEVFWRTTCARLAAEPIKSQVEPVAEALPYGKFKVTLHSLEGVLSL